MFDPVAPELPSVTTSRQSFTLNCQIYHKQHCRRGTGLSNLQPQGGKPQCLANLNVLLTKKNTKNWKHGHIAFHFDYSSSTMENLNKYNSVQKDEVDIQTWVTAVPLQTVIYSAVKSKMPRFLASHHHYFAFVRIIFIFIRFILTLLHFCPTIFPPQLSMHEWCRSYLLCIETEHHVTQ